MKQHSALHHDFIKKKELVSEDGKIKFNNQKTKINAKGKTKSSQKWLSRQMNDPFANAAKIDGYLARSAYKLLEINKKYRIFEKRVRTVIDLGCSPGSWSQVILTNKAGIGKCVIGVDLLPIKFQHENLHFIQGDFESADIQAKIVDKLKEVSGDGKADCIVSDIALNNIGNAEIDRIRSERIAEQVLSFAELHLSKGGHFVCKTLKGADNSIFEKIRKSFRFAYRFKPNSSRKDSSEMFIVGIFKIC